MASTNTVTVGPVPIQWLSACSGLVQSRDAMDFLEVGHQDLVSAPLKSVKTFVLDSDTKALIAHIKTMPRRGLPMTASARRTTRRPNDILQLNDIGEGALLRKHRSQCKRGELWAESVVFKLEYGCTGTKWCDSSARVRRGCSCDLRLVFSATIEQVSKGQVHVQFCGPRGKVRGASWHSSKTEWQPHALHAQREHDRERWGDIARSANNTLLNMQAQLITVRREQQALVSSVVAVNSDAVPQLAVSASPPVVAAVNSDAVPPVSASPSAVAAVNSDAVPPMSASPSVAAVNNDAVPPVSASPSVAAVNSDAVPHVSASPSAVAAVNNDAVPPMSPSAVAAVNSDAVPQLAVSAAPQARNGQSMTTRVAELEEQARLVRHAKRRAQPTYTRADRDRIMMHGADGHQATATRNLIHRDSASADGVDGMVCNVPSQHYAQSVLDNAQRQRRGGLPAYEALRELCDGLAIEQRIILYLEADPAIDPAQYSRGYQLPQGAMQMVVFATPAMIDAAVDLDEIGVDTKHRTNEDKGCVQAIMWFKQRTQSRGTESYRPEFRAGYCHHDAQVLTICIANLDNYWTVKLTIDAIRAMMPCTDPACDHPIRRVLLDARGSFRLERACSAQRQRFAPLAGQTDKAAYEVRALRSCGIRPVLCRFHVFKAILEFCAVSMSLRCHETLAVLLMACKFISGGRSKQEVMDRWKVVKTQFLPCVGTLSPQQRTSFSEYIEENWVCEYWIETWTNIVRNDSTDAAVLAILQQLLTQNNAVERFWKTYLKIVCKFTMFKRRDDEARAVGSNATNLLDSLALDRFEAPTKRTNIAADVHNRTLLALAIVIRRGVQFGPNGVTYVRAGLSSRKLVYCGSHQPKAVETRVPQQHRGAWNVVRVWMRRKFVARGVPTDLGCELYCQHADLGCECCDGIYRGQQRGGCKHQMAKTIRMSYPDEEAAISGCIRDFAHQIRERERRTPKELQIVELLNTDAIAVWNHCDTVLAPTTRAVAATSQTAVGDVGVTTAAAPSQSATAISQPPTVSAATANTVTVAAAASRPSRGVQRLNYAAMSNQYNPHREERAVSQVNASKWSGDFATAHTVSSSDDEDTPPSSMQATTNETAILSSLQACGVVPSEVVEDELDQFAQELDHQETSLATRTGRSKAIEAKQRHQWRGGVADTRRPKFGLKNRSRPGGIAAIHRVDASKTGRSSRLASVAQIRGVKRAQSHANTIATATSISAERRGEKRGSRPSAVDTEPAAKEGRTGISF